MRGRKRGMWEAASGSRMWVTRSLLTVLANFAAARKAVKFILILDSVCCLLLLMLLG